MPKEFGSTKRSHYQKNKRDQLWNALLLLLENKPLGEISIQNICETAMIHRTTFYNHFYGIFDLLRYGTEQMASELIPEDMIDFNADKMSEHIICIIMKHKNVLSNLTKTDFKNELLNATDKVFEEYTYKAIAAVKDNYRLNLPMELTAKFFCAGLSRALFYWINKPNISERELKRQAGQIIQLIKRNCTT